MDDAREHLLAGAGLAGEQDRQRGSGRCCRAMLEELDRLLGDPQALGVAVEGLGRPQRGALLLVAAVAVEGAGGGDQLADGGERAAMIELGPRPRQDLPGFVAMLAEAHEVVVGGRPQGRERLGVGPAVLATSRTPRSLRAAERQRLGTARVLQHGKRLAPENVRMARELEERDGGVEVVAPRWPPLVSASIAVPGLPLDQYLFRRHEVTRALKHAHRPSLV